MSNINNHKYKIHWIRHAESCANLGQGNYIDKQTINKSDNEYFGVNNNNNLDDNYDNVPFITKSKYIFKFW